MNVIIRSVARYTAAQRGIQVLPCAAITLMIAGQRRIACSGVSLDDPSPYLVIAPQGTRVEFECGQDRDQWTILMELPGLAQGRKPGTVEFVERAEEGRLVLPMFTFLPKEHITGWEGEFLRLREAFRAPCPANRLRLRTGVGNVFRYVIDQRPDVYLSPAAKLRWLIDEDQTSRRSLEALSRQCGFSASRLRVLFEREFGQSPQVYRNRRRMHVAADLLINSDLRIKEVSEKIGCRHLSHFSALFRATYATTPSRYRSDFRQRAPAGTRL
jgi:AraC-like DNA-binding protein